MFWASGASKYQGPFSFFCGRNRSFCFLGVKHVVSRVLPFSIAFGGPIYRCHIRMIETPLAGGFGKTPGSGHRIFENWHLFVEGAKNQNVHEISDILLRPCCFESEKLWTCCFDPSKKGKLIQKHELCV